MARSPPTGQGLCHLRGETSYHSDAVIPSYVVLRVALPSMGTVCSLFRRPTRARHWQSRRWPPPATIPRGCAQRPVSRCSAAPAPLPASAGKTQRHRAQSGWRSPSQLGPPHGHREPLADARADESLSRPPDGRKPQHEVRDSAGCVQRGRPVCSGSGRREAGDTRGTVVQPTIRPKLHVTLVGLLAFLVACTSAAPPPPATQPDSSKALAADVEASPSVPVPEVPTSTPRQASGVDEERVAQSPSGTLLTAADRVLEALSTVLDGRGVDRLRETAPSPASASVTTSSGVRLGRDGRLTVLLIGSDQRTGRVKERTDGLLVVSVNPRTKRVSMASIHRGTIDFPRHPKNGGGTSGTTRVNFLYQNYKRESYGAQVDPRAVKKFKKDVAYALKTEIDYTVLMRFGGYVSMVDSVSGVEVRIPQPIRDSTYGAYFPASSAWHLDGDPRCYPDPQRYCRSALRFVRTRKGYVGDQPNSNIHRNRRQQEMTRATIRRVIARGTDDVAALVAASNGRVTTTLPRTLAAGLYLYDLLDGASTPASSSAVLAYPQFGYRTSGDDVRLYLSRVRDWCDLHMGPVT